MAFLAQAPMGSSPAARQPFQRPHPSSSIAAARKQGAVHLRVPRTAGQVQAGGGPQAPAAAGAGRPNVADLGLNLEASMYRSQAESVREFGFRKDFNLRYEMGEKIGRGASCTVHVATDKKTGEQVAVKVMPKQFGDDGNLQAHFARRLRNEVDIASRLGGSLNVSTFYGAFETDSAVHLVVELCSGGQLWERILRGKYSEWQAARLVQEVLRTIAQCHAKGVMMRDVKPQNFLFSGPEEDARLKAVDFGISVFCKRGQYLTQRAGTRIVMAPEVVRQRYTLSADLWSAGVMAYLLLTGRLPFPFWEELYVKKQPCPPNKLYGDILYATLDFSSPPWDALSADAKDLVQSLLERDESKRLTAEEALQHRWFQDGNGAKGDVPLNNTIVQRLQRFGTYGRLKQVALRTLASCIPTDSVVVQDLRGLFLELDPTDTGRVPYARLQMELEEGRFTLSSAETRQLLAQMDVDPSGCITFKEWVATLVDWSKVQESTTWDALVERAFQAFDRNSCGRIGPRDLELLLCGEEGCPAPDVLDAALREIDVAPGSEGIDLDTFRRLLATQVQEKLDLFESRLGERP